MARLQQFRLPDLGEGLTEGEILRWLVAPGDVVRLNQPIVEVETAKAAVEVPSPYAGLVTELHWAEGDTADVGSPIITVDTDPSGPDDAGAGGGGSTGNTTEAADRTAGRAAALVATGAAANPVESGAARSASAVGTVAQSPRPRPRRRP